MGDKDNKCAPNKKYTDGSCFTLKDLKKMSISFNIFVEKGEIDANKIEIKNDKKHLLLELTNKLENICDNQICWLKQKFVKQLKDKELLNNTFRPDGPQGKFEWLSTIHINDVMEQYENKYNDFKFLGAVPIDFDDLPFLGIKDINFNELYNSGKKKIGFVFNLDEHWQSGSHWVALYSDLEKNKIYFFDSYGKRPEKRIRNLVKRISKWCYGKDHCSNRCSELNISDSYMKPKTKNTIEKKINVDYNHNRHQYKGSECGVYSLNFILRQLNGESYEDIVNNKTLDDDMNLCRDVYFKFSKPFNTLK
jgi:hypothetical protein